MPDVLLIEPCNFEDFPTGGQLSFAKQMIKAFGPRLALVGICTDSTPVGRWITKCFDGVEYQFLAVGRMIASSHKPVIPARMKAYVQIKKCKKQIMAAGIRYAFVRAPEALMAVSDWGWDSLCYCCPGLKNPLVMARYAWGKLLAGIFFEIWVHSLRKVDVILAAADDRLIDAFVASTRGRLTKDMVIKFPTRVDTSLFRPIPKCVARKALNIDEEIPLIVNCGRINNVKGWKFLCDAFRIFLRSHNNAQMVFVGDGEDRQRLQKYIYDYDLTPYIKITGFKPTNQVAEFLNAASIVVVGSYYEGWSLAMLEALACGKSIVSTDVSGAKDMILEDGNGYIIEKRDPKCFAEAMNRGLALTETEKISLRLVKKYALKNLARDLGTLWKPLQQAERGSIE